MSTPEAQGSVPETLSALNPGHARYEPTPYLKAWLGRNPPRLAFSAETREECVRWRRTLVRRFRECLGIDRIPRPPLEAALLNETDCGDHVRRYYVITTSPDLPVPAFLLIPKGIRGRRPAIVCSHGHGYGANELVGLDEKGAPRAEPTVHRDFALHAVRHGFVTLAHDQFGFGRRRDFSHIEKFPKMTLHCQHATMAAIHLGLTNLAFRIFDAMRMVDFLQGLPEVNPRRIGMAGISGGGIGTQFTAALEPRIRACCVSGFTCTFEASILSIFHCPDNYIPGLGVWAEDPDVACLIAPRAQLIQSGVRDPIFPIEATKAAAEKARKVYSLLGAEERLETEWLDDEHVFSNAVVWDFMARHLGRPPR